MDRQFNNKRQSLTVTDKQEVQANYSTDQKDFTSDMLKIKLEKRSYNISFKK